MFKKITLIALVIFSTLAANAGLRFVEQPKLVSPVIAWADGYTYPRDNKNYWCAVDQIGLKCWGWLSWEVPSWRGITQLVSGKSHMCALMGNDIKCISTSNEHGEIDVPKIADPEYLYAGEFHNCVITKSKQVTCWGKNIFGQATPPAGLENTVSLSPSRNHTCALSETGKITCWGDNSFQQLVIPENLGVVRKLEEYYDKTERVGEHFWSDGSCALDLFAGKAERSVCWGKNYWGPRVTLVAPKVGDLEERQGHSTYSCGLYEGTLLCEGMLPLANLPELGNVKSFATGRYTGCAVKSDSTLVCWGRLDRMYPEPRMQSVKEVQTSPAGDYLCASHSRGLSCWGSKVDFDNGRDYLEVYDLNQKPQIDHVDSFALSNTNACVIDNQNLKCWGSRKMNPPPKVKDIKLVVAGAMFFCSLDTANEVRCWTRDHIRVKATPKLNGVVQSFNLPSRYDSKICVNYQGGEEQTCWNVF